MVTDNKLTPGTRAWTNGQTYLQEDTESYGKLLGTVTSYYNEQYNISSGKKPINGGVISCEDTGNDGDTKKSNIYMR
jgi:hypothetical protein